MASDFETARDAELRDIAQARERLLAPGVRTGLVVAVESMTRARLDRLASGTANDTPPLVPDQPEFASARDGSS